MVLPNDLLIIMICKDTQLTNNIVSLDQFSAHQNQIHCVHKILYSIGNTECDYELNVSYVLLFT